MNYELKKYDKFENKNNIYIKYIIKINERRQFK